MLVMGLDTATDIGAIGLIKNNNFLGEVNICLQQRHSERLLENIDYLLGEAGVDKKELSGLAVSLGPGSFTGLRIGLTCIKTMAQFLQIPVVGISTLELFAASIADRDGLLLPLMDARHKRVYTALFQGGNDIKLEENRIWPDRTMKLEELIVELKEVAADKTVYLIGPGCPVYSAFLQKLNPNFVFPPIYNNVARGGVVAARGKYYLQRDIQTDYHQLNPVYLKKAVHNTPGG